MSLFVAVRPDDDAGEDLLHAVDRVRRLPQAAPLRWQPPAQWHVTLAFLGDPDDSVDDEVAERLDSLAAHAAVEGLRLAGAGCFGRQVLWIGIAEGDALQRLARLQAGIPPLLRGSGVDVDRRPWRAHLTVARARGGDARAAVAPLAGYVGPAWSVRELLLIRSTGGPRSDHRVVARIPLAGTVDPAPPAAP